MRPKPSRQRVVLHAGTVGGAGTAVALRLALAGLHDSASADGQLSVVAVVPRGWPDPPPAGITFLRRSKIVTLAGELVGHPRADVVIGFADRLPLRRTERAILVIQNPHVSSLSRNADFGWRSRAKFSVLRMWARFSARRATEIVCSTPDSAQSVTDGLAANPSIVRVVPIPADIGSLTAGPTANTIGRIVSIGDRYRYKRVDVAIDAVAAFARRVGRPVEFRHVGASRDPIADQLIDEAIARAAGSGVTVRLLGSLPHSEALAELAAADVALFTSMTETQGIPVAEALALGVPVVARDIAPFRFVGVDVAALVPSGSAQDGAGMADDDAAAFAEGLVGIVSPEVRQDMSARGRRLAVDGRAWDLLGQPQ